MSKLEVSASDFQLKGRWLKSGLCRRVVSLDKKLCSILSLSPPRSIADIMLGVTLRWTSISSRGE